MTLIPTARKSILVVDDDETAAQLLAEHLSREYEVRTACDGSAGLRAIAQQMPDLIVCDVNMPRMDGYDMIAAVQARPGRHPPVIFVTARSTSADVLRGIQVGARHYLKKPVDVADLDSKVRRALSPTIAPPALGAGASPLRVRAMTGPLPPIRKGFF